MKVWLVVLKNKEGKKQKNYPGRLPIFLTKKEAEKEFRKHGNALVKIISAQLMK